MVLPKIKRFIKNNKKEVKIGILVLIAIIVILVLYKSLFYSDSEKAVYGVRLRDIKEHEFEVDAKKEVINKTSDIEGVSNVKIEVKGRLIKLFITFDDGISQDDIKNKFNETLTFISDDVKNYYDVTFYAIQTSDGKTKYPVIGYKKKKAESISFDVF